MKRSIHPSRSLRKAAAALRQVVLCVLLTLAVTARALPPSHYAAHSVLASGNWYKISVTESGIHEISYTQLRDWGFSDPSRVHIYGYGGAMLNETVSADDVDDLPEIPVLHYNNRILFYAQGTVSWWHNSASNRTFHRQNTYSTVGCYFITESDADALQPGVAPIAGPATGEAVDTYDDYVLHEQELASISRTGRVFLGEDFRYTQSRDFSFYIPGIVNNTLNVEVAFGAKMSGSGATLQLYHNGSLVSSGAGWSIGSSSDGYEFMKYISPNVDVESADGDDVFTVLFRPMGTANEARLDYIQLTCRRNLQLYDGVVQFRDYDFPAGGTFAIGNFNDRCVVWDITTQYAPLAVDVTVDGDEARFSPPASGREYIAFDPAASFPVPAGEGTLSNQDLHGMETPDMVILAPRQFLSYADRVAALHESVDSMKVAVIDHELVFNEFSSGTPDAVAYRRLIKMFYDRAQADPSSRQIRYLLLFGRGFYDNRRLSSEIKECGYPTLLTYQNPRSDNESYSFVCDDFFTYLDDDVTTTNALNKMRIAVGRFPVKSNEEASIVVEKLYNYVTAPNYGAWRNQAILVADDENSGTHMNQAESVEAYWKADCSDLIVNKVYIDAFPEQQTSTGRTYPDAKSRMMQLLEEGQLVLDYIGHANAVSWTGEDLLNISDIRSMYLKNLPFMITATCDFSRYDSEEISGGELFFLNEFGGAIGLFSSTRVAWINENGALNNALARYLFEEDDKGRLRPVGDVIADAKNYLLDVYLADPLHNRPDSNKLVYTLLGDPAMRLGYPSYQAQVTAVNGMPVGSDITLEARSQVTIEGRILSPEGEPLDDFYGLVMVNLYDAEQTTVSNGYGDGGVQKSFKQRSVKLFSGRANVDGGRFSISFKMPKETSFSDEEGLISLYAYDAYGREASGASTAVKIGGTSAQPLTDTIGPDISYLYLNTTDFQDGDVVNESPMLIAAVSDSSGINISSAGIGHVMTVMIDGKTSYSDVSSYFVLDTTCMSGVVNYPLSGLSEGAHTLTFRVWDNEGNSSTAELHFTVQSGLQPQIYRVYADQNPARTSTNFYLEHDRPDGIITVTVTVYNLMGMPVWQSSKEGRADMFKSFPITWNLVTGSGGRVPGGIYVYRATISTDNTHIATASQKLCVAPVR